MTRLIRTIFAPDSFAFNVHQDNLIAISANDFPWIDARSSSNWDGILEPSPFAMVPAPEQQYVSEEYLKKEGYDI